MPLWYNLKSLEKSFYSLEHLKKSILTRVNILSNLRDAGITMDRTRALRKIHTKRRIPTPAKIAFAGENTYKITVRVHISTR
jgi:hypothetical protein